MKKTNNKSLLSVILSFVLIAVIALTMFGCTGNKNADTTTTEATVQTTEATSPIVIGEGEVQISFSVTHKDGTTKDFTVNTSKDTATVGEALQKAGLIAGDMGDYGLYVKTVDGETLDYNTDGMYWAFYENGAYGAKGVDQTSIDTTVKYEFKAEK